MTTPDPAEALLNSEDVRRAIEEQLRRRLGGRLRDFDVAIESDGVTLWGLVPTYYGKQMAQGIAMQVSGLNVAANYIDVY